MYTIADFPSSIFYCSSKAMYCSCTSKCKNMGTRFSNPKSLFPKFFPRNTMIPFFPHK